MPYILQNLNNIFIVDSIGDITASGVVVASGLAIMGTSILSGITSMAANLQFLSGYNIIDSLNHNVINPNTRLLYNIGAIETLDFNNLLLTGGTWSAQGLTISGSSVITSAQTGSFAGSASTGQLTNVFAALNSPNSFSALNNFNASAIVSGNLTVQSNLTGGNGPIILLENLTGVTPGVFGPEVVFNNHVSGSHGYAITQMQSSGSQFCIVDFASPYTTYLCINQTGNIGINNQLNPQYTLDILGSGNFSQGLYVNGNSVITASETGNFLYNNQTSNANISNINISGNISNFGAGLYSFSKTIGTGTNGTGSANIFAITGNNGVQIFDVMIATSPSGYGIAKKYGVVNTLSNTPNYSLSLNSGPVLSNDFSASFVDTGIGGVVMQVINNITNTVGGANITYNVTLILGASSSIPTIISF